MPSSPPASTGCSPLKASGSSPRPSGPLVRTRSHERFIGTVRRECLDRLLVFHRAQLETVLSEFFDHNNEPAPFAAEKKPLRIGDPDPVQLRRRDKLGGLVHEYRLVA